MKKKRKSLLFLIFLLFSLPHIDEATPGTNPGGLVGNGKTVEEPLMGVAFTYPSDWEYLNAPDETSFVTIQVSEDGRFLALSELKTFLETEFPYYVWSSHKLGERDGFSGKSEGITSLSRYNTIEAYFDQAKTRALLLSFQTTEETLKEVFEIKATLKWK